MNSALRMTAGPNETVVHSKSVKVSIDERSSSLNGRVDRFVTNIKRECLGKFILFGRRHLDYIVSEWVEYYNTRRSHMVREHLPPVREKPEEVLQLDRDQVVVRSYVGGLVKSFERRAA